MPSRLILGADSFGAITGELDARKAEYEKWKSQLQNCTGELNYRFFGG
jgi:hypothetical protein